MNEDDEQNTDRVTLDFDGRDIVCREGKSLAAALTEAGVRALREGANGEMRGLFCGMGVCQECRVTVDGRHGIRACMFSVNAPHEVSPDRPQAPREPVSDEDASGDHEVLTPDVLVIGGGAGGLTAASVTAEAGAETMLLDERPAAGGQFFKQPYSRQELPPSLAADPQIADGAQLIDRATRTGVRMFPRTEVWGAFAPGEFAAFDGSRSLIFRPKSTIVATGAYERGLPLPGWTLPGVMTTGAAQVLLRSYGVLAGRRILVAGNGPLNLQVALELKLAGADVVSVLELAAAPGIRSLPSAAMMFATASGLTMNGLRYLRGLRRAGVPVSYRHGLAAVEQKDDALVASIGPLQGEGIAASKSVEVDVVCMGYGFQPNNEVLRGLGCRHHFDEARGHLVTERSTSCETSVSGIYAVGDCCGLGGAPAAQEEGVIAACAAVRALGAELPVRLARQEKLARRDLRRHLAFQSALWRLFAAPRFHDELADENTLVCRCEGVSLGELDAALDEGGGTIGAAKRATRLGMGACQGRYCAPIAAAMIARRNDCPVDEYAFFAPRPPIKPMRIDDILKTG